MRPGGVLARILLINPNSTVATTRMMVAIARDAAGQGVEVTGATATRAPPLITEAAALAAAASEVIEIAQDAQGRCDGLVVAAFGDPGLAEIRDRMPVPAVGIGEAAVHEAAEGGRRFGIATTTPGLADAIGGFVRATGLGHRYTGIRLTPGDPAELMGDPAALLAALSAAIAACIERDGAEAVVIGGGPLGQAAAALRPRFAVPIVEPIPAAMRRLRTLT